MYCFLWRKAHLGMWAAEGSQRNPGICYEAELVFRVVRGLEEGCPSVLLRRVKHNLVDVMERNTVFIRMILLKILCHI